MINVVIAPVVLLLLAMTSAKGCITCGQFCRGIVIDYTWTYTDGYPAGTAPFCDGECDKGGVSQGWANICGEKPCWTGDKTCCCTGKHRLPTPPPSNGPTDQPTNKPTEQPTKEPTSNPTQTPTSRPSDKPTNQPTSGPTQTPTLRPTHKPTDQPSSQPTSQPTQTPTSSPTNKPTDPPTSEPTQTPTLWPTTDPTHQPTNTPTQGPTASPTKKPTGQPTFNPTQTPMLRPTNKPTAEPTEGCCSRNYKTCINYCGTTQESCEICSKTIGGVVWLPNGPQNQCKARWIDCTQDKDGCCDGLTCVKHTEWWWQCLPY